MSLYSAARGLWWVVSEVVDAAKQLCGLRPDEHSGHVHVAVGADRLAEYEAGVECLEPQDDCGLGGFNANTHAYGAVLDASELTGAWEPQPLIAPLNADEVLAVRRLLESSAAPGVAPVEAADKDPGVSHSPTPGSQTSSEPSEERPAPAVEEGTASSSSPSLDGPLGGASDSRSLNISGAGHLTSLTADEVYMAAVGAHWYAESALDVRWSAYRDLGYKLHDIASQMPSLTLGNDPAAVHDRAMRQRHNENREQ